MKLCSDVQRLCVVVCMWWGQPGRGQEQMPRRRLTFSPALPLLSKAITASPGTHPSIGGPLPSTQSQEHARPLCGSLPRADCGHLSPHDLMRLKPGHCAQLLDQVCHRSELPLLLASCLSENREQIPSYKYTPDG